MQCFTVLAMPIYLIWKIQIKLSQKVALSFSLCLTVCMIAVTIVRMSGIVYTDGQSIDAVWEIFWSFISAEVGLLMSTLTAFRAFFVSRSTRNFDPHAKRSWYSKATIRVRLLFSTVYN